VLDESHERAPNATIIIVGYPWLLPRGTSGTCTLGYNGLSHYDMSANMNLVDGGVDYVDGLLRTIVNQVAANGIDVHFADPRGTFVNHDACEPHLSVSSSPWTNQEYAWINPLIFQFPGPGGIQRLMPYSESFHANAAGQEADATLVQSCYGNKKTAGWILARANTWANTQRRSHATGSAAPAFVHTVLGGESRPPA
jgi:hypothetical protein